MTAHAAEFFTLDEVNRLKIIQDVVDRRLTTLMAAQRLGISDRQCRRLLSRYRESGPLGMASRRRGKPSNNQLPDGLARYALNIIRERYTDFGPTLACEKLAELHDIHLSKETVRSLMVKAGLWIPRKQRAPKVQQPRYRRACCGELIQIDGCDHRWFENRAPACNFCPYPSFSYNLLNEMAHRQGLMRSFLPFFLILEIHSWLTGTLRFICNMKLNVQDPQQNYSTEWR